MLSVFTEEVNYVVYLQSSLNLRACQIEYVCSIYLADKRQIQALYITARRKYLPRTAALRANPLTCLGGWGR
jgi:hypothetical protein